MTSWCSSQRTTPLRKKTPTNSVVGGESYLLGVGALNAIVGGVDDNERKGFEAKVECTWSGVAMEFSASGADAEPIEFFVE